MDLYEFILVYLSMQHMVLVEKCLKQVLKLVCCPQWAVIGWDP